MPIRVSAITFLPRDHRTIEGTGKDRKSISPFPLPFDFVLGQRFTLLSGRNKWERT